MDPVNKNHVLKVKAYVPIDVIKHLFEPLFNCVIIMVPNAIIMVVQFFDMTYTLV